MKVLKFIWKQTNNIEHYLSIIIVAVMFTLVFYQVILRFIFNNPNRWSEEAARYLHIYMIFICCSYAARMNAHIRVDAIMNMYPKSLRPIIAGLGEFVWLAFCIFIVVISIRLTRSVARAGQFSVALKLPLYLIYAAIPIGYTLTSIRIIQNRYKSLCAHFAAKKEPRPAAEGGNS